MLAPFPRSNRDLKLDRFPAKIIKDGNSKAITIPHLTAENYEIGEKVEVTIKKVES